MARPKVSPSQFTGWWLRLRRQALGVDRAMLARRSASRGASRVTRTLLVDLELGRRQPNLRTLPQLALALEMPAEILAALVLASDSIAPSLEPGDLESTMGEGALPATRRAAGALLGGRSGPAFALAELAGAEEESGGEWCEAPLLAASAALALGLPAVACWRAKPVYELGGTRPLRASAALIFARAAWKRDQRRIAAAWLDRAGEASLALDEAWRALLEGRLALGAQHFEQARASLLLAHESALLAGSPALAAEAARELAEAFESMKRPDLARRWRHRVASAGPEGALRSARNDRKTFG